MYGTVIKDLNRKKSSNTVILLSVYQFLPQQLLGQIRQTQSKWFMRRSFYLLCTQSGGIYEMSATVSSSNRLWFAAIV